KIRKRVSKDSTFRYAFFSEESASTVPEALLPNGGAVSGSEALSFQYLKKTFTSRHGCRQCPQERLDVGYDCSAKG
ncbi:MAG: hypothetical protein ABI618_19115, partial [Nitrospirota bacterium]